MSVLAVSLQSIPSLVELSISWRSGLLFRGNSMGCGLMGTLWSSRKANAKSCTWDVPTPCISTGWGPIAYKASGQKKTLVLWLDKLYMSQQSALAAKVNSLLGPWDQDLSIFCYSSSKSIHSFKGFVHLIFLLEQRGRDVLHRIDIGFDAAITTWERSLD